MSDSFSETVTSDVKTANLSPDDAYCIPASVGQRRFWTPGEPAGESTAANMPIGFRLTGSLDTGVLAASLNEIVRRHEALRTSFAEQDGQLVQVIAPSLELAVAVTDLRDSPAGARESTALQMVLDEVRRPFALEKGPLIRARLLRLGAEDHIAILTVPHIIGDGWSNGLLVREWAAVYSAYVRGLLSPLPELELQYADFAHWQNEWLQSDAIQEHLAYWKQQLQGKLPVLDLPFDRPPHAGALSAGEVESRLLPADLTSVLKITCKKEDVTPFMLFLAAFETLLHRYTGQEDILVGSPDANRRPETEGVFGPFAHPLSLRTSLAGNPTFRELLGRVREVALGALVHHELPFARIVDELEPEQLRGRNPLFQIYFMYQVAFLQPLELPGLHLAPLPYMSPGTPFDLHLTVLERPEGVRVHLEYSPDLFEAATIRRMLDHYEILLRGVAADCGQLLSDLPLLNEAEHGLIAAPQPGTSVMAPPDRCIHEIFEDLARRNPGDVAACLGEQKLTYGELNDRADQVARRLRAEGAGPEVVVGVYVKGPLDRVTGVLGVLKAGGAYLLLNPEIEPSRLAEILRQAGARVVLTQQSLVEVCAGNGLQTVCLDAHGEDTATVEASSGVTPDHPACARVAVVSGKPEVVLVTHRALLHQSCALATVYGLRSGDQVLRVPSRAPGAPGDELFSCLVSGATASFSPELTPGTKGAFMQQVAEAGPTVLILEISQWYSLLFAIEARGDSLPGGVRLIAVHGDGLSESAVSRWQQATRGRIRLLSHYGAPETSESAISFEHSFREDLSPGTAIGRPLGGNRIHVLDSRLRPMPIGAAGEIYIGSDSLARGYLNQPDLTKQRFVADPFRNQEGARLFRTADSGRILADGSVELLGPAGRHINLYGFRAPVSEVEFALRQCPDVKDAAVMARYNRDGEQELIAYVVWQDPQSRLTKAKPHDAAENTAKLRGLIQQKLPKWFWPAAIVVLPEIPMGIDGQLDHQALSHEEVRQPEEGHAVQDAVEFRLTTIWKEILGVSSIGVRQNFFDIGGNSLLAAKLLARVEAVFKKKLPLAALFASPTIEELGVIVRGHGSAHSPRVFPIQPNGSKPPFFFIHAWPLFRPLAQAVGLDRPFLGLAAMDDVSELPVPFKLQDLAAYHVKTVRDIQPEGPYRLAGWCLSGPLAYEAAQQLVAQGQEVKLLVLFDASNPADRLKNGRFFSRVRLHLSNLARLGFSRQARGYLHDLATSTLSTCSALFWQLAYKLHLRTKGRVSGRLWEAGEILHVTARNYVPKPYPGRVALFRPTLRPTEGHRDLNLGWDPATAVNLEVYQVPGDHTTMFQEPNVGFMARILRACLEETPVGEPASDREPAA